MFRLFRLLHSIIFIKLQDPIWSTTVHLNSLVMALRFLLAKAVSQFSVLYN